MQSRSRRLDSEAIGLRYKEGREQVRRAVRKEIILHVHSDAKRLRRIEEKAERREARKELGRNIPLLERFPELESPTGFADVFERFGPVVAAWDAELQATA